MRDVFDTPMSAITAKSYVLEIRAFSGSFNLAFVVKGKEEVNQVSSGACTGKSRSTMQTESLQESLVDRSFST